MHVERRLMPRRWATLGRVAESGSMSAVDYRRRYDDQEVLQWILDGFFLTDNCWSNSLFMPMNKQGLLAEIEKSMYESRVKESAK